MILAVFLAACAGSYEERCAREGLQAGTPEIQQCIDRKVQEDRALRSRVRRQGRGGARG